MLSLSQLLELSAAYGDAFYTLDAQRIRTRVAALRSAFADAGISLRIAYSVKTNSLPYVVQLFQELGCFTEVVSEFEYELVQILGYSAEEIVVNGPLKREGFFKKALADGALVQLDGLREIQFVREYLEQNPDAEPRLGVRCNLPLAPDEMSRFGFSEESLEAVQSLLFEYPQIRFESLHCHFTKQIKTVTAYCERVRQLVATRERCFEIERPSLNLGGGISSNEALFPQYANEIAKVLQSSRLGSVQQVIVEPGVALTHDGMALYCQVHDVKQVKERWYAVATAGIHTVRPTGYDRESVLHLIPRNISAVREERTYAIAGYTCMEHDIIWPEYRAAILPGDFLCFTNLGAYTTVFKPPFIELGPAIISVEDEKVSLIRKRESVEDFLRGNGFSGEQN